MSTPIQKIVNELNKILTEDVIETEADVMEFYALRRVAATIVNKLSNIHSNLGHQDMGETVRNIASKIYSIDAPALPTRVAPSNNVGEEETYGAGIQMKKKKSSKKKKASKKKKSSKKKKASKKKKRTKKVNKYRKL